MNTSAIFVQDFCISAMPFQQHVFGTCCWEGNWCYAHWNEASSLLHCGSKVLSFHYIGVLFFDLRKAFDKVWHRGLLVKLNACGVAGAALNGFASYLSNRQQCVKVNQSISSSLQIHAGVPQGAMFSPLLFIIYMNDISRAAPKGSSVNLFADDTSLYVNDTCPRQLANELQHAADCLSSWFTKWLLTVNPEKTAKMIIRRKRMAPLSFQIFVNGKPVPQVLTHKHPGLIIEDTLSWTPHVISVAQEQRRRLDNCAVSEIAFPIKVYQRNSCTRHRPGESLNLPRTARLIVKEIPRSDTRMTFSSYAPD